MCEGQGACRARACWRVVWVGAVMVRMRVQDGGEVSGARVGPRSRGQCAGRVRSAGVQTLGMRTRAGMRCELAQLGAGGEQEVGVGRWARCGALLRALCAGRVRSAGVKRLCAGALSEGCRRAAEVDSLRPTFFFADRVPHVCKAGAACVRRYLREHDYSNVVAKMVYTSKTMAPIEVESPTSALARTEPRVWRHPATTS